MGSPATSGNLIDHKHLGDELGIRVVHVWDFKSHYGFIPSVHSEDGLQFLSFVSEPLESPTNRLVKRAFDIAVALALLHRASRSDGFLFFLAQRLQSPGPLFFVQERRGQNDGTLRCLSSMRWILRIPMKHNRQVPATNASLASGGH